MSTNKGILKASSKIKGEFKKPEGFLNITGHLTRRGYVILKSLLSPEQLIKIRKELTVSPKLEHGAPSFVKPKVFKVYQENDAKIYLPRNYATLKFGLPSENRIPLGTDISVNFRSDFQLGHDGREYQLEAIEACKKALTSTSGGGILQLFTGAGKTVLMLYLIANFIKGKTLIVVNNTRLLTQWVDSIKSAIPDAKVGKIQQNIVDVEGKDIVVAMLQSLVLREYSNTTFSDFRATVYDECHHLPSEHFSQCMFKVGCRYNIGVSATPERKDGLTKLFTWHVGETFFVKERERGAGQIPLCIAYKYTGDNSTGDFDIITNKFGKLSRSAMITRISSNFLRLSFVVNAIKKLLTEDQAKRSTLILSERVESLEKLEKLIRSDDFFISKGISTGLILGSRSSNDPAKVGKMVKMKTAEIEASKKCDIILGTYKACGEGIDIPALNTLILLTPLSDIKQAEGRIHRIIHKTGARPVVIDLVDQTGSFNSNWSIRKRFLRESGYEINEIPVDSYGNITDKIKNTPPREVQSSKLAQSNLDENSDSGSGSERECESNSSRQSAEQNKKSEKKSLLICSSDSEG